MATSAEKKKTSPEQALLETVRQYIDKGVSANIMTWAILGGVAFMPKAPNSMMDFITVSIKGIPKSSIVNLARVMDIPMKDMSELLNVSYKTIGRKKNTDSLSTLASSLSIEIAGTISKGLTVFEDAAKFNRWLQKENRALNNRKPIDLLNTPTGIKMVSRILGRIEEGVYT